MIDTNEKILTWHPAGKRGSYISRNAYVILREFIFSALKSREMSIIELIDLAQETIAVKIEYNVSWAIWVVKLDLEARGFLTLKSRTLPYPSQSLKLKHGAFKKIRAHII